MLFTETVMETDTRLTSNGLRYWSRHSWLHYNFREACVSAIFARKVTLLGKRQLYAVICEHKRLLSMVTVGKSHLYIKSAKLVFADWKKGNFSFNFSKFLEIGTDDLRSKYTQIFSYNIMNKLKNRTFHTQFSVRNVSLLFWKQNSKLLYILKAEFKITLKDFSYE